MKTNLYITAAAICTASLSLALISTAQTKQDEKEAEIAADKAEADAAAKTKTDTEAKAKDGFISMFNGKDLTDWKVNGENPKSVRAENGNLIIDGPRTHAFYAGANHDFKNFEFKAKVKTFKEANSGIYFHTKFQDKGWPEAGYECQVNNTHKDPRKTGSLYAIKDNGEEVAKDEEWFDYYIKVEGKKVVIKINGKVVTEYTEPENPQRPKKMKGRLISSGTIGLQAHDPKSVVHYKDLMLKILD